MTLIIRLATHEDGVAIVPHLRRADRDEVYWQGGLPPELIVPLSVHAGSLCAEVDGQPQALFGCAERSALTRSAAPWLLGTQWLEDNPVHVLRHSRRHVAKWQHTWHHLSNHVSAENAVSIAWLRWLGFTMDPVAPHGPFAKPFHKFWWDRHV